MSVDLKELKHAQYELMSDEEVVDLVRDNDAEALEYLINKYKNFVRAKRGPIFSLGQTAKTSSKKA